MQLIKLTSKKAEEVFKKQDTIIITIGSVENHGINLPLGTDTLIPNRIIELLEKKNDIIIAPTIPYSACDSKDEFSGTISIGDEGLLLIINKITENFMKYGIKKFVLLNGHSGNMTAINNAAKNINVKGGMVAVFNWWLIVLDINKKWMNSHGEETEEVDYSLVDMDALEFMDIRDVSNAIRENGFSTSEFKGINITMPTYYKHITSNSWVGKDHPSNATREWGEEMFDVVSTYLSDFINEFKKVKL